MADLRINIDTSGVVRSEKTVDRTFKKIIRNSNKLNNSILLVERAINKQTKTLSKGTKTFNTNSTAIKKNTTARKGLTTTLTKQIAIGNLAANAIQKSVSALAEAPRVLKEYSDAWLRVNNIIRLGVESEQELVKSRQQVIDIAIATRTPLTDQVKLFNRLTLSQRELGASNEQILGVIKGVGQALGVTATSTLEARGSLIQLAQAFGQPIVRAEEFNSILEGTPRIAKALADGFGLTRAQLRKLVLEGKVTNKEFFEAFQTQLPALEREFKNVQPTIDSAITVFSTGFGVLIGQFNEMTGLASKVAGGIELIGKAVKSIGDEIGALNDANAASAITKQINSITKAIENLNKVSVGGGRTGGFVGLAGRAGRAGQIAAGRGNISPTTTSELSDKLAILSRAKSLQEVVKAAAIREKQRLDELKDIATAEAQKLAIIKKTFSATGIISKEGYRLLVVEINKEKDIAIKAGLDKVSAAEAAAVRIAAINTKILNKETSRLKELQKQNRNRYAEEIKAASQIKDLNLDRLESVRENTDKINKEIAQKNKKFQDDELRRVLEVANKMEDLNLARLEGLKNVEVSPVGPQTDFEKYVEELNEAVDATAILENATISAFQGMEDALVDYITTGEIGFRDLASTAVAELTRIFVKSQIIAPAANLFNDAGGASGIIGSIGKMFMSANGNVATGDISSASNTIVTGPTLFPGTGKVNAYANGGSLVGEGGRPEGILPLTRVGADLGVKAEMAQPQININVENNNSDQSEVTVGEPTMDEQGRLSIGIWIDQVSRNVNGSADFLRSVTSQG